MTETKMRLEDWLDDLCVRFVINLPREELESVERICFQVEEAQWFYEDFIRPLDPSLPSLSLKAFSLRIFQHCPLMSQWSHYHHMTAFSEFLAYKTRVPVRGAILLNEDMDEVVLVKGWKKGANWSFPRGKINKDEKDLDCAIREVYEETGYDVREAGLVENESEIKAIDVTMREQHMKLFVIRGVPRDTYFEPRTRKEISKIEWYKLSDLPTLKSSKQQDQGFAIANANKFYMVAPFLNPLKKWISQQKRADAKVQPALKPRVQREGEGYAEKLVDATNTWPSQATPAEMATASNLPEVVAGQDATSHLKRLLNINNPVASPNPLPSPQPAGTPGAESSKSNALLELLRSGSAHGSAPQTPRHAQPTLPADHPGVIPPQPPNWPNSNFPGFPPQGPFPGHLDHPPHMPPPHGPMAIPPGSIPPFMHPMRPPNVPPPGPLGAPPYRGLPTYPQQSAAEGQDSRPPPGMPTMPMSQAPAPAPYQRTGDPEFSQSARPMQPHGPTIPPASNLPPPKLTSHSLALLNVFKDDSARTPKTSHAGLAPPPAKESVTQRKPSHHQDQLLSLLKGSPGAPRDAPAELAAPAVSQSPKQILQRPREPNASNWPKPGARPDALTSATVSGPLNMPQFEANPRQMARRSPNNSNRKAAREQGAGLSSPITILPRPQTAKKDYPSAQGSPSSRTPSQPRAGNKPIQPEPTKPFQPQILRRSEQIEGVLPVRPKEFGAQDRVVDRPLPTAAPDPMPQAHFDRRPSQTAAQRETLLSLFGKPAGSPGASPAAAQANILSSMSKPSAASSIVSPLSPVNVPPGASTASVSPPQDETGHSSVKRVASPDNKAFLLGFLQGVAKGNK